MFNRKGISFISTSPGLTPVYIYHFYNALWSAGNGKDGGNSMLVLNWKHTQFCLNTSFRRIMALCGWRNVTTFGFLLVCLKNAGSVVMVEVQSVEEVD